MAAEIIELIKKDKTVREEISKFVATEITLNPELRELVVKTIAGNIATKDDLRELENRLRGEIKESEGKLREEIKNLEERMRTEIKESEERVKNYVDVRISDVNRTMQVGFTVLAVMIAGFTLLVGLLVKLPL